MASSKPFYTDNMTIEEIMALGDDTIRAMDKRDISRAVRTLSLAANKRLKRLSNHAIKSVDQKTGDVTYTEKGHKGIDFEALYANTDEKGNLKLFGVGRAKDVHIGTIKAEFERARNFLKAPSTKIPGAIALRQKRERQVFGKTREQLTKGMTKAEAEEMTEEMKEIIREAFKGLHEWKELSQNASKYDKEMGKRIVRMFQRRMSKGMDREEARGSIDKYYDKKYEKEEAYKQIEEVNNDIDFWSAIKGDTSNYEI
jgi:hypothetical protein